MSEEVRKIHPIRLVMLQEAAQHMYTLQREADAAKRAFDFLVKRTFEQEGLRFGVDEFMLDSGIVVPNHHTNYTVQKGATNAEDRTAPGTAEEASREYVAERADGGSTGPRLCQSGQSSSDPGDVPGDAGS